MRYTGSIDRRKANQNPRSANQRPIHILQVVGGMDRGGIETWLMHILRHIDRDRFRMDFLVYTTQRYASDEAQPYAYDDEICALGSQIIPCLEPELSRPWTFASNFKRVLREYGPYDIIHSHLHHFSGYVLRLAQQAGVPVRIAHCHNDHSSLKAKVGWRRLYLALMEWWVARHGTVGLGCSRKAAADLFGPAWETDPRWRTLYNGIDLVPFQERTDAIAVRAELGIPTDAFVIGHVGRFVKQKNHLFLLQIAAEIAKREPKMHLLLVGDGPLRLDIEQQITQLDLTDHVVFAGVRPDVTRLMLGAMDIFLFPSIHEGLGLVLIEAQAAGLPCIFSDVIPEEADVVKSLVRRLSLSQPVSAWVEALLDTKEARPEITPAEALMLVEQSPFNIQASVKDLEKLYLSHSSL